MNELPPIVQIVGYSDSGKTTLLCALVRRLTDSGLAVATLKHHGHRPGESADADMGPDNGAKSERSNAVDTGPNIGAESASAIGMQIGPKVGRGNGGDLGTKGTANITSLAGAPDSEPQAELDLPDKDTWLHLRAGAVGTGASSAALSAVWTPGGADLDTLALRLPPADLIVAEGFKTAPYAKWVLLREPADETLLDRLTNVIGISAVYPFQHHDLPVVERNDIGHIAELIRHTLRV